MSNFRPGRFQVLPTVVKNLLIINVIMVVAQFVLIQFGIDLADYLGLHYWRSPLFKWWQLITHMFMHGSAHSVDATVIHLFSNMFALWIFGSVLENVWGPKRFLTFYIICGLGAALLHLGVVGYGIETLLSDFAQYQQNPTLSRFAELEKEYGLYVIEGGNVFGINMEYIRQLSENSPAEFRRTSIEWLAKFQSQRIDEATVGASGAVFGILFAFGYLFPNTLLYLYFLVPIKAKYVVAFYAIFELYAGIQNSAGDNVAHFAHLGGMLVGFIMLKIWNKKNRNTFY